jgi:hypothetical protein
MCSSRDDAILLALLHKVSPVHWQQHMVTRREPLPGRNHSESQGHAVTATVVPSLSCFGNAAQGACNDDIAAAWTEASLRDGDSDAGEPRRAKQVADRLDSLRKKAKQEGRLLTCPQCSAGGSDTTMCRITHPRKR